MPDFEAKFLSRHSANVLYRYPPRLLAQPFLRSASRDRNAPAAVTGWRIIGFRYNMCKRCELLSEKVHDVERQEPVRVRSLGFMFALLLVATLSVPKLSAQAGPPFQTDDPTPVDLGHYEAYIFGAVDGTPVELDPVGPAFEFNWGAIPNIQLHAILPFGAVLPTNNPAYAPSGTGPSAYGLTDMEFGIKYGFVKQTKHRPQIGSFTMFEIPTGSYSKGLGVGKVWYKLPIWVEKEFGAWSLVGGVGYGVIPQTGYRNYLYGGYLVKREINKKLELSAEVFSHAREGFATPQTQSSTLIDAGGYYHLRSPGFQLLFAYGHSVAGQTENYAYLGLYKTWGKDKDAGKKPTDNTMLFSQRRKNGF